VKDSVRQDLEDRLMQATIKTLRGDLANQTATVLQILDPELKRQYDAKIAESDKQVQGRDQAMKELERERKRTAASFQQEQQRASSSSSSSSSATSSNPASTPAAPMTAPAAPSKPAASPEGLRPPATMSAVAPGSTGGATVDSHISASSATSPTTRP
jgi:hypothetical protein